MDRFQKIMIAHGFLVTLVGMLAGFMLMFKMLGGLEYWPGTFLEISVYGTTEGWIRAHSGGVTNGMLTIIVALALPKLELSERMTAFFAWGLIYCAWTFTAFYWIGNRSANRALSIGDNVFGAADWLSVIGFVPGLPSVFIGPIVLYIGARAAFKAIAKS
ncbi:isomerase [Alphaproteobacteria bacterium]|nr:isomerase [Alphaproteobacteria bacterium]MDA8666411.1 isomerase [Alphaproteobacteria bacterium]MDB2432008.1 isomerase [Alphaproteobacteria bacterium]MDB2487266.1 isomerase [Alphaproteobacteria bacterium]MDB2677351.1 isomerase [Alphaproteobacteria bacterium]